VFGPNELRILVAREPQPILGNRIPEISKYMRQDEAQAAGYRPASGKSCG